ncbi:Cna B-type domain-containing protein, partial [Bacillus sp. JCM 19034]|uniref:Cna B-type domain-containing protein n=1 Tax=Bacillus sp. JCM 19034 TaxID=1481928 RepID=UPI000B096618
MGRKFMKKFHHHVKIGLVFTLVFSLFFSSLAPSAVFAAEEITHADGTGAVLNEEEFIDYTEATLSKNATYTGHPGEYFIDLTVTGKDIPVEGTTDIVIVYDNSNSMATNNRVGIAHDATVDFISEALDPQNNANGSLQMALVTYGTVVLDGRFNPVYRIPTQDVSSKDLTTNAQELIDKLPNNIPSVRGEGNNGGTFTEQAILEAESILESSIADNQMIITITDGVPTVSYNPDGTIVGNGTSFTYNYGGNTRNHGQDTIREAQRLQGLGYNMFAIGIELSNEGSGATREQALEVLENLALPGQARNVEEVGQMGEALRQVLAQITSPIAPSISEGIVIDPMGEMVRLKVNDEEFTQATNSDLTDGDYYLSASENSLLDNVEVSLNNDTIQLEGLFLGENESIHIRYKVQLNTEHEDFEPDTFYETNGTTTLQPLGSSDQTFREFPIPKVSGKNINISGEKVWMDSDQLELRPETIEVQLWMSKDGEDVFLARETITPDEDDSWNFVFEDYLYYDSNGEYFDYFVRELEVDGYETTYADDSFNIINTLIPTGKVEVVHVDEDGNELVPGEEIVDVVGEEYETAPEDIAGYELVEVPQNATGEITEEDQRVVYVYRPVAPPTGKVEVV